MKLLNIILGAALFAKSIFGYEINIIKPEYQSGNITLSDNITDIIDEMVKDISSYSIHQNDIIINVNSTINEKLIDLIDIIDDEAIKYMGNNKIKVNYPVLSIYKDKYKNLYEQYDVSNNKSLEAGKETGNNKNELSKRNINIVKCMNPPVIQLDEMCSCILGRCNIISTNTSPICIYGSIGLILHDIVCILNDEK